MILRCTCKHQWQDRRYGEQMRVHNGRKKVDKQPRKYQCTVCSMEKEAAGNRS